MRLVMAHEIRPRALDVDPFGEAFTPPRVVLSELRRRACNKEGFNHFLHRMLDAGVHLAPSAYEAGFVSAAHTAADVEETVRVASEASRRPRR